MKKSFYLLVCSILLYGGLIIPFTGYMKTRPFAERLGYPPNPEIVKAFSADQREIVAAALIMKVIFYFGGTLEKNQNEIEIPVDYPLMAKIIHTALKLDPYNKDIYYFTQATFAEDPAGARAVNALLTNGMRYRTWDPQLPFFAGFNAAFVLKDYKAAALFMKRAGELSGEPIYSTLASKYFNEAGQTDLGIMFMASMEESARDQKIKKLYTKRKNELLAIKSIKDAVASYRLKYHRLPDKTEDLVAAGLLKRIPSDPYGGGFYLDDTGNVKRRLPHTKGIH